MISNLEEAKKISVIVPVYNSEKYITRCIQSVQNQTYGNWELILVDDGSQDNSLRILDSVASIDERIKVYHQENAGPGSARNAGIKRATGEYVVFVDSDDTIYPDYLEKLASEKADVVFIDIDQVDENGQIMKKEYMSRYSEYSKDDFLRSQMTGKILWGGGTKSSTNRPFDKE